LPHDIAVGLITSWTRFRVQEITLSILTGALEIKAAHGFSYRDSAIIAAARAVGCSTLYSEDLSHGREVEGITITNPFR
jgi:predicted nucleic acid-binding protein